MRLGLKICQFINILVHGHILPLLCHASGYREHAQMKVAFHVMSLSENFQK